jgi:nucleoid-associated protein YgaU
VTEDRDVWGNGGYVVRNPGLPEATSRPVRISRRVMLEGELEAAKTQLQAALDKASAEEARRKELEAELADVKAQLEAFETRAPAPEAATRTYTVKKGDTLWEIADAMYGSGLQWPRIYNANKDTIDDPNRIKAGQVLRIP